MVAVEQDEWPNDVWDAARCEVAQMSGRFDDDGCPKLWLGEMQRKRIVMVGDAEIILKCSDHSEMSGFWEMLMLSVYVDKYF